MKFSIILKRFRKGIAILLSLVLIENIAWIIEPSVFGDVIDALIDKISSHNPVWQIEHIVPLIIWIVVYGVNTSAGVVRRLFDQKIFLKIFAKIAAEISIISNKKNLSASKIAGISQLSEEYITFFQYRMPEIMEQIIGVTGTIIALATFDWRISVACLTIGLPFILLTKIYNKKVSALHKDAHDIFENTFEVFSNQKPEEIEEYYLKTANSKQKIAKWSAVNYGIIRTALLVIFLIVLYISIDLDDFSTGNIYSVVAYIWAFITSAEYIPELMDSWTSLKDISQRIKLETI
ncbi:MAG: ABC transporter six-transmembrane domain-containing protein [Ignavibacteriales bacterium]|nr:ABC transporter six-transmembrane domain-containing protein [Ignavibacteriales bacterium]